MTDDLQRLALARSIAARLPAASLDDLRLVDKLLTRLEQSRFTWRRRVATGPGDIDTRWHLAVTGCAMVVTRCHGRWSKGDTDERNDYPPILERCLACQRAAWRGTELDALIAAALEELADEDRERAGLREAARIEMLGPERTP